MRTRINFVLTAENEELLNEYNCYAPEDYVLNMSKLLNTLLQRELSTRLNGMKHVEQ
jgi:hypothetical protein